MDLDSYNVERSGYNILDLLSNIGGILPTTSKSNDSLCGLISLYASTVLVVVFAFGGLRVDLTKP